MKTLLLALLSLAVLPTHAGTVVGAFQGASGLPVKNATINFTLLQAGLLSGTGSIVPTTVSCATDGNGNVVQLPNMLVAPSAAVNLGSGTLPGGIYFVTTTWLNGAGGETAPSPELRIQLSSTGSLQVALPRSIPAGATGINVYAGTVSGNETLQGTQSLSGPYILSIPLVSGAAQPTSNSTVCSIAFNDQIIPYTGYTLSLISASGNAYPGFPQSIQLNGGQSGVVNVSQGLPLWNGTVIYPMPLLSQPLNHGPQSISGNLDHGGYNDTNIGVMTAGSVNSVVNASLQAGSDIGAQVNNALASCVQQCTVYVPAGNYTYTTTIQLPLIVLGTYELWLDQGAKLQYNGSAEAILAPVSGSPNATNFRIHGGAIYGTSAATAGVHILPTNAASIKDMLIFGFTGGPGLWLDGPNGVTVFDNMIQGNQTGILLSPTYCNGSTCGTGVTGSAFTPNQIWIGSNRITNNLQWGIQSTDPVTSMLSGALNDVIDSNDLEINGRSGSQYGAVNFGRSHGVIITGNYFEGSPRQIVLGIPGGGDGNQFRFFSSQGPQIINNYFTDVLATPFDVELLDTTDARIEGNTTDEVSRNSSNCFVDTLANNGTNIGETGTYFGKNHVENYTTGGNTLCIAGAGVTSLVGAGSFSLPNLNLSMQVVAGGNYTITSSGTSETVSIPGLTVGSVCGVYPSPEVPGGAATAIASTLTTTSTPGILTMTHPSSVLGVHVAFSCSLSNN